MTSTDSNLLKKKRKPKSFHAKALRSKDAKGRRALGFGKIKSA
jgi:hypothetical protein